VTLNKSHGNINSTLNYRELGAERRDNRGHTCPCLSSVPTRSSVVQFPLKKFNSWLSITTNLRSTSQDALFCSCSWPHHLSHFFLYFLTPCTLLSSPISLNLNQCLEICSSIFLIFIISRQMVVQLPCR